MTIDLSIALSKIEEFLVNETLSRAQLEFQQLRKFRALVRHACKTSAYYEALVHEHGIDLDHCVPSEFPILTKQTLMEHFDAIATDRSVTKAGVINFLKRSTDPRELYHGEYHIIQSSGSSGYPGHFVHSRADLSRAMAQGLRIGRLRYHQRELKGSGRVRLAYYAAVQGHYGGVTALLAAFDNPFNDIALCDVCDPLARTVARLNQFQPDFLNGYTDALRVLAAEQLRGTLHIAPSGISTSGETLTPAARLFLQSTFGCPITNSYASSEHLLMGLPIMDSDSLVLNEDDLIYEINEDHTVVTNLCNFTLPLIRYRHDDVLILDSTNVGPYRTIHGVIGRAEFPLTLLNEHGISDAISPIRLALISIPWIRCFQFHRRTLTSFEVSICMAAAATASQTQAAKTRIRSEINEILLQKEMSNVSFCVDVVPEISKEATNGKFRLVV